MMLKEAIEFHNYIDKKELKGSYSKYAAV